MKKFLATTLATTSLIATSLPATAGERCWVDNCGPTARITREYHTHEYYEYRSTPQFFRPVPHRRDNSDALALGIIGLTAGIFIGAASQQHNDPVRECLNAGGRYYLDDEYCER